MNTYELNEDQIARIEARLNLNHLDITEGISQGDPERATRAIGWASGASIILDEIGYDPVWDNEKERVLLRRQNAQP